MNLPGQDVPGKALAQHSAAENDEVDYSSYIPRVSKSTGEWYVSETDLAFIAEGCGVLGTGKSTQHSLMIRN